MGFLFLAVVAVLFIRAGINVVAVLSPSKPSEKKAIVKTPKSNHAAVIDDSKQIISDKQVGRAIAKAMCGERSMQETVDYLNSMGVPKSKIENFQLFPDLLNGFASEGGFDCSS